MKRKKFKKADLDKAFSLFVRTRDQHCQVCGTDRNLQCAHIVSRRYMGVRWDPANAVALCRGCHLKYTVRPLEWEAWVIAQGGEEFYRKLKFRALAVTKVDYQIVAEQLGLAPSVGESS